MSQRVFVLCHLAQKKAMVYGLNNWIISIIKTKLK
jgi:hypothetical protein